MQKRIENSQSVQKPKANFFKKAWEVFTTKSLVKNDVLMMSFGIQATKPASRTYKVMCYTENEGGPDVYRYGLSKKEANRIAREENRKAGKERLDPIYYVEPESKKD